MTDKLWYWSEVCGSCGSTFTNTTFDHECEYCGHWNQVPKSDLADNSQELRELYEEIE